MDNNSVILDFKARINSFVERTLSGYTVPPSGEKVIHDPIWGSVLYKSWEIKLIDSPLLQRLRDIHQLGMADLTYTAARHSRFEHSLGTTAIAGRMISRLRERYSDNEEITVSDADVNMIRLAALLHDVGHCFHSHLSESIYGDMSQFPIMTEYVVKTENCPKKPAPHELFSYLIVTSEAFTKFFHENIDYPNKGTEEKCRKLLRDCARMIIGVPLKGAYGETLTYMTSIINGEFDADKLDYTQRDSYTAGLAMTYGIDRFLLKLIICRDADENGDNFKLAVGADALTIIEELLFNRYILYVYMYRHQKVLATESVIKDIIGGLVRSGKLTHPCDFLFCTDNYMEKLENSSIFPYPDKDPSLTLGMLLGRIKNRRLPKRIFETDLEKLKETGYIDISESLESLCAKALERNDPQQTLSQLKKLFEERSEEMLYEKELADLSEFFGFKDSERSKQVREEYFELLKTEYESHGKKADFSLYDLHICFPKPFGNECSFLLVNKDGRIRSAAKIAYINKWLSSFSAEKWKGYVFCNANVDKELAKTAFLKLLKSRDPMIKLFKEEDV